MKGLTRVLMLLIALAGISISTSAYGIRSTAGYQNTDWVVEGILETSGKISQGDDISLTFSLTNIGPNSATFSSLFLIFLPPAISYSGFTSQAGVDCFPVDHYTSQPQHWSYGWTNIYCGPNHSPTISMGVGSSIEFQISGSALEDFSTNTTKFYAGQIYSFEGDVADSWTADQNVFEMYSRPYLSNTAYTYTSDATTTSSTTTTTPPTTKKSNVLGTDTSAASGDAATSGVPGYAPTEDGTAALDSSEPEARTATRSALLRETPPDPKMTWTEFIAKHRVQFASGSLGIMILAATSVLLIRRSRKKHQSQREYRHALTILKHRRHQETEPDMSVYMPSANIQASQQIPHETLHVTLDMTEDVHTPSQN